MYSVQCMMYTSLYTMYGVHFTPYIPLEINCLNIIPREYRNGGGGGDYLRSVDCPHNLISYKALPSTAPGPVGAGHRAREKVPL